MPRRFFQSLPHGAHAPVALVALVAILGVSQFLVLPHIEGAKAAAKPVSPSRAAEGTAPAVVAPGAPAPTPSRAYGAIGFTAHAHPKSSPAQPVPPTYTTGDRVARRPAGVTPKTRKVSGPTSWSALNAAISRIPGYRTGGAKWVVTARYGHWGATDLATGTVYISPNVPVSKLDSVARHEWAHVIQGRVYGHRPQVAFAAMNRVFGGSGLTGTERSADCMARLLGATWTNYTTCSSASWRASAKALLAGRRL